MGKTVYSRNPSVSKGTNPLTKSPAHPEKNSEFTTKIHTKPQTQSREWPSPRLKPILRMFSPTEDASLTRSITEASEELDRLLSSEEPSEDGPKNLSRSWWDYSPTCRPTPMPKIWRISKTLQSTTCKSIEPPRDAEEPTEPTEESGHISPVKHTSRCTPPKRQSMSRGKAKPDKSLKEKSQSENND